MKIIISACFVIFLMVCGLLVAMEMVCLDDDEKDAEQ